MPSQLHLLLGVSLSLACSPGASSKPFSADVSVRAVPAQGPLSGQTSIEVRLPASILKEGVSGAWLGEADGTPLAVLHLEHDDATLRFTDQGSPTAGRSTLIVETRDSVHTFEGVYTHQSAVDPVFHRMAAVGASLTQGVQGGVPTTQGLLRSPGALLARQSGGFLPLPLLVPDLFPSISATDIGPAPTCEIPGVTDFVTAAAMDVLGQLSDETGVDLSLGRQDPSLPAWHLAVGGSKIADLVDGPSASNFAAQFLSRLVYAPQIPLEEDLGPSQLERVVDVQPTLILTTDLAGNDVILPLTKPGPIDLSQLTPHEEVAAAAAEAIEVLASTGAVVLVATLPRPTLLPLSIDKKRRLIEEGAPADEVQAVFESVDALTADNNAALVTEAARWDNVHIVDLAAVTERIHTQGVAVGDQRLYTDKLGGLISTDGVHFSDLGYALTANAFIDELNEVLDLDVPRVDLEAVASADPYHPDALRAAGLDPSACD